MDQRSFFSQPLGSLDLFFFQNIFEIFKYFINKDVKNIVRKQMKKEYPNGTRIVKKEKRVIAKMVLEGAVRCYDFSQEVDTPTEELLCIKEQMPTSGIMNLESMARFIKNHENSKLYSIHKKRSNVYKADEELRIINNLLDDQIIDKLLS